MASELYIDLQLPTSCGAAYNPATRTCAGGAFTAYNSLSTGLNAANPGDTVILRAGNYGQIAPPKSGAPGRPITIKSHSGENSEIRNLTDKVALLLVNKEYIVIEGVHIQNVLGFGRLENSTNIQIKNVTFASATSSGTTGAMKLVTSSRNRIENCSFSDGSDVMVIQDNSDSNIIVGNSFFKASHSLISIRCSNKNVIRNNTFSNPDQKAIEIYDCEGVSDAPYRLDATKGNILEYNHVIQTAASSRNYYYNAIQHGAQRTIVRFNVFRNCLGGGVNYQYYSDESLYVYQNRMYNNTFYSNHCNAVVGNKGDGSRYYDNRVLNNLLYKNVSCDGAAGQTSISDSSKVILTGNVLATANPGFANEEAFDFMLLSTSPHIDKGVFLATTTSSGSGASLPVNDVFFFYDGHGVAGEAGDTIQLQGQNATATVVSIDYQNKILNLDKSLAWQSGQGVGLKYTGTAPDVGAYEYGVKSPPAPRNLHVVQ